MNKYYMDGKSRFSEEDKEVLRQHGLNFFYELRDREGLSYAIEKCVIVNNIGCIATNFEITECNTDIIMDDDFFNKYHPVEITLKTVGEPTQTKEV